MNNLIPPIGSTGIFTLKPPFQAMLLDKVVYICEEVRTLAGIAEAGEDPFETYYEANSLDEQVYQEDLRNGVAIVSLRTEQNRWVYVPSSYVLSYANPGGVPYTVLGIGLNLGPLPNDFDTTALIAKINALVRDNVGVEPDVQLLALSEQQLVSHSDHQVYEAVRRANITDSTTDRAKLLIVEEQRDRAIQEKQVLEQYIIANIPPP